MFHPKNVLRTSRCVLTAAAAGIILAGCAQTTAHQYSSAPTPASMHQVNSHDDKVQNEALYDEVFRLRRDLNTPEAETLYWIVQSSLNGESVAKLGPDNKIRQALRRLEKAGRHVPNAQQKAVCEAFANNEKAELVFALADVVIIWQDRTNYTYYPELDAWLEAFGNEQTAALDEMLDGKSWRALWRTLPADCRDDMRPARDLRKSKTRAIYDYYYRLEIPE